MNLRILCEKLGLKWGCTWVVRQDDSQVRWNTTKAGNTLEPGAVGPGAAVPAGGEEEGDADEAEAAPAAPEPRTFLECIVCGKTVEEPTPEQVKQLAG